MRPALMYFPATHAEFEFPVAAVPADMPRDVRLQIVSSCAEPPAGDACCMKSSMTVTAWSRLSLATC